jgi:hypothetical protein
MSFNVGDVVRKVGHTQIYKVKETLQNSKYKVNYEPLTNPDVELVFKEADLELAS